MFSTTDTIVAIATPPGHGGIGVVRIGGPDARRIARNLLSTSAPLEPRRATFTRAVGLHQAAGGGEVDAGREPTSTRPTGPGAIDQVVATYFPAPHSYTGEDVVEVSAHGSPVVLQAIVRTAMSLGARLAEPGEFTLRAFLNGRMDLVQAEAVADLVDAVTPLQARAAFDQLEGTLTRAIGEVDGSLFDLCARLEASVDFPDEGYHFIEPGEVSQALQALEGRIGELVGDGKRGRMVREGRQVAIAGKPNVGKSTLFNALLGTGRAIVTPIPGTTRDVLTETTDIGGARVCLVDTAGIRCAADAVEREGIDRAREAATVADVVVLVLDRSRPLEREDRELLAATARLPRVVVVNKCDLPAAWQPNEIAESEACCVSLMQRDGADVIRQEVTARLGGAGTPRDVPAVTNLRHLTLLEQALRAVGHAREAVGASLGQMPEEFVLADLQHARHALEEVTGRRTSEDLLRHIFSRFCIGK